MISNHTMNLFLGFNLMYGLKSHIDAYIVDLGTYTPPTHMCFSYLGATHNK